MTSIRRLSLPLQTSASAWFNGLKVGGSPQAFNPIRGSPAVEDEVIRIVALSFSRKKPCLKGA